MQGRPKGKRKQKNAVGSGGRGPKVSLNGLREKGQGGEALEFWGSSERRKCVPVALKLNGEKHVKKERVTLKKPWFRLGRTWGEGETRAGTSGIMEWALSEDAI